MEAEELRQRLAKALGWTYIASARSWCPPAGPFRNAVPDWSIVPVVLAAIEAKGWYWSMQHNTEENDMAYTVRVHGSIRIRDDMIEALCEAFVAAVEAHTDD